MAIRLPQLLTSRYTLQHYELMLIGMLVPRHVCSTRPSPRLPAMLYKLLKLMPCSVHGHWLVGLLLASVLAICHDTCICHDACICRDACICHDACIFHGDCDGHQCLPDGPNLLHHYSTVASHTEPILLPMSPLHEHNT